MRLVAFFFFLLPLALSAQTRSVKTYYNAQQQKLLKEQYSVNASRQLHGSYISYYTNGKVKSRGTFVSNVPSGPWAYFYENGNPKMAGELRRNQRHGDWRFYYEDGQLQSEGAYTDGLRQGYWKFYYESGGPKSEGSFRNDKKTGTWQYYYEDGQRKATAEYGEGGLALYREWLPSGIPSMEGWLKNEISDSTWQYFHEDGSLKAIGKEKNGEKNGLWKFNRPDGKLSSEGEYVNGQPNGTWRYFHENGELASEGQQRNGVKEGEWQFYSDLGERKVQSRFSNGQGLQEEYYPNGKVKGRGPVKDGKYEGRWEYYSEEDGTVNGECFFVNGRGTFTGYYPDGKLRLRGTLENDRRVGEWTIYKPDGTLAGYYHTFYGNGLSRPATSDIKNAHPDTSAVVTTPALPYNKPPVRLPRRRSRYFTTRPNEFRGYIVGVNPFASFLGSLPLSVEYYFRERLGYEAGYILYRQPFLTPGTRLPLDKLYNRGFGVYLRQKFYQPDDALGMFYFAHEVRFTEMDHRLHVNETSNGGMPLRRTLQADENLYEYSIMVGDRWMADPGGQGFTLEGFLGIGIGYRHYSQRWTDNSRYDSLFDEVHKGRVSVPLRLGLSIGYVF